MKSIPNLLSFLRIAGTAALLFVEPFTPAFLILYTLCGLTDVLDGLLARVLNAVSELGARLDSAADLLFYAVMLLRIFPVLWLKLPRSIWFIVGAAVLVRIVSYSYVAIRYRRFASLHTIGNKLTGLMVYATPYFISLPAPFATPCCFAVAIAALLSSAHELALHLCRRSYSCETTKERRA